MAIGQIVVGVTETETSQHAARTAVDYARALGATVHFVTVVRKVESAVLEFGADRWEVNSLDDAQVKAERFVSSLPTVERTVVALEGDPANVLLARARELGADLIVVGNVRVQGAGRLLGSVAEKVLHHAPCDVLVVKTT
jgi:nucleotide-binding universal stress UspA family protein